MFKKKTLSVLFVLLVSLFFFGLVVAQIQFSGNEEGEGINSELTYTPTTDTICKDGICTKTLYSGVRNVYEDDKWKRVEDARSLKDKGFNIVVLEDDEEFPIEVVDFNYTSISVKLNPKGIKIFNEDIPLRVWNSNNTKAQKFEEDVFNGKKISKGIQDYKEKMNKIYEQEIGFNLLNQEEERTLEFGMGKVLEFGYNSTTITLQDNETENLEDVEAIFSNPDTNYGSGTTIAVGNKTEGVDSAYHTYIKFDISEVLLGSAITNGVLALYQSGDDTFNVSVRHVYNQSWVEDEVTWNGQPCGDLSNSSLCNLTNEDTIIPIDDIFNSWNVTNIVNTSYSGGDSNLSFILIKTEPDVTTALPNSYVSKENTYSSQRPYLNITYDLPPDTCSCPGLNEDWEIDHSDSCTINDACDLGTGTLSFTGSGTTICNASINTSDLGDPGSDGEFQINSNCEVYIS